MRLCADAARGQRLLGGRWAQRVFQAPREGIGFKRGSRGCLCLGRPQRWIGCSSCNIRCRSSGRWQPGRARVVPATPPELRPERRVIACGRAGLPPGGSQQRISYPELLPQRWRAPGSSSWPLVRFVVINVRLLRRLVERPPIATSTCCWRCSRSAASSKADGRERLAAGRRI